MVMPFSLQAITKGHVGFAVAGAVTSYAYQKFSNWYEPKGSDCKGNNCYRNRGQRDTGTSSLWVENKTDRDFLFTFDCEVVGEYDKYLGTDFRELISEQISVEKQKRVEFDANDRNLRCPNQKFAVVFDDLGTGEKIFVEMKSDRTETQIFPDAGIKVIPRWHKNGNVSGWHFTLVEIKEVNEDVKEVPEKKVCKRRLANGQCID